MAHTPYFEAIPASDPVGLRLVGELDMDSIPEFLGALARLPAIGEVTLDLEELSFVDSTGLHAIVSYAVTRNGVPGVVLANPDPSLHRILEVTRLDDHPKVRIAAVPHIDRPAEGGESPVRGPDRAR